MPIISKGKWSALSVFVPPSLGEQERIAAQLAALSVETQHLASIYERKQAALGALKKSILHQAFAGEL
jgi:type I restriction enzyme S subunit